MNCRNYKDVTVLSPECMASRGRGAPFCADCREYRVAEAIERNQEEANVKSKKEKVKTKEERPAAVCSECGKKPAYCQGLCTACYSRMRYRMKKNGAPKMGRRAAPKKSGVKPPHSNARCSDELTMVAVNRDATIGALLDRFPDLEAVIIERVNHG